MKGGWETAKWLTDELPFLGRSSLKPHCAIPTSVRASLYDLWSLGPPLPIPLRVQFSDKQKHIQALASHFTLCALAGGNAFLEPLAYSPKNGSSWLSFKKKKKEWGWWEDTTCGGLGPIFHPPRSLLNPCYQSHRCSRWVGEPAPPVDTLMRAGHTSRHATWSHLSVSLPPLSHPRRTQTHTRLPLSVCHLSLPGARVGFKLLRRPDFDRNCTVVIFLR